MSTDPSNAPAPPRRGRGRRSPRPPCGPRDMVGLPNVRTKAGCARRPASLPWVKSLPQPNRSRNGHVAPTTWRIGSFRFARIGRRPTPRRGGETVKKLILRVLYSTTTLALIVFVLGAGGKHPHGK